MKQNIINQGIKTLKELNTEMKASPEIQNIQRKQLLEILEETEWNASIVPKNLIARINF